MNAFFQQFGKPDIYTKVVLEEFFRELYAGQHKQAISLPSEKRQEGDPDIDHILGTECSADKSQRCEAFGSASGNYESVESEYP
jgi:hypothetical protein